MPDPKIHLLLIACVFLAICSNVRAQGRLILNGGVVVLADSAALVIANADSSAIRRIDPGFISSEGAANLVVWAIGAGNGSAYIVPFGATGRYFPISFKPALGTVLGGASGAGAFLFSTFPTEVDNSSDLPSGVTNMTITVGDNSAKVIDRFWQVKPQGYSTPPSLTNLSFAYSEAELAAPNDIADANLMAYRWNQTLHRWNDYFPSSSVNTVTNTVTVATIPGNQLFNWWTLVDVGIPLPLTLLDFTARWESGQVVTNWRTSMEQNSDHFEVWRSTDSQTFDLVGSVAAAGNSNAQLNYSFVDGVPYPGVSYYRLKSVDRDARFTWSAIVRVDQSDAQQLALFPSPATTQITIVTPAEVLAVYPQAILYNVWGQRLKIFRLSDVRQVVDIAGLTPGVYQIQVSFGLQNRTLRFVKL